MWLLSGNWSWVPRELSYIGRHLRQIRSNQRAYLRFLETMPRSSGARHRQGPAVVVVRPWWGTAEPYFHMTLAALIEDRFGDAAVLFDDSITNPLDVTLHVESRAIAEVMRRFQRRWYRLSDFRGPCPLSDDELNKVALFDSLKGFAGEEWSPRQQAFQARTRKRLGPVAGAMAAFFSQVKPRYVTAITGFQSTVGLVPRIGAKMGIRVATTDGNEGSRLMNVDGIAAHLTDLARVLEMYSPLEPWAIAEAQRAWQSRTQGTDRYGYQPVALGEPSGDSVGVLLPLNQSYDTSALDRSRFFAGQSDWMLQLIAWLLEHTRETITVRQHPVERLWPGADDYHRRLRARFGDTPRLRVHDCHAAVNTYDLVRRSKLVLPHTSSVGLEAVLMRRPVVIEARTFYDELLPAPANKEEYFAFIERALAGAPAQPDSKLQRAWEIYFLSQLCCYLPTVFTAYAADFAKWSREPYTSLAPRPDVAMVLEALEGNVPLPALRYQEMRAVAQPATAAGPS